MAAYRGIGTGPPMLEHDTHYAGPPLDGREESAQNSYESVHITHAKAMTGNSDSSSLTAYQHMDSVPERRWRIHWRYPALTLLLFVAGILLAVGHDIYYEKLDGQRADLDNSTTTTTTSTTGPSNALASLVGSNVSQQTWAIRIGTGLAFLCKTAFSVVVGFVGAQQIWYTLRQKDASINRIDGMFQLIENPLALLDWGLLWHAKLLFVLALVSWLLPLASIVTPSTLSVQSRQQATTVEMTAPGLNFSDYKAWVSLEAAGYVTGANFDISTLFSNLYSSVSFVPMKSAPFANASYDHTLYGPSYKCISLNEALAANITPSWTIANPESEVNTTYKTFEDAFYGELNVLRVHTVPRGNMPSFNSLIYNAVSPLYMFNTILVSAGGTNTLWDAQGKNNNSFVNTTTTKSATVDYYSGPYGTNLVCQLYNTSFDVTFQFENGVQSIIEREIKYLEPQAWDSSAGTNALLGPCSGVNASFPLLSESDPWSFTNRGNCNQSSATYYVTHLLFTYLLTANLRTGVDGSVVMANQATIPLLQSPFIHCPDFYNSTQFQESELSTSGQINPSRCRNGTLASAIEDMSRNFTYSLLAFDGWANYSNIDTVLVTYTEPHLFFTYARGTLWAVYGAAIGATLLTLLVGVRALLHNGVVSSTSFSSILLTTSNPHLHDTLIQAPGGEACHPGTSYTRSLGAQPIERAIGELRLRFGHIDDGSGVPQAGFGVKGTVQPLR